MSHSRLILAVAFAALSPPVHAQGVDRVRLAEPQAAFHEPFSRVTGVRELADGSLIVADRLEQAIRIIDFRAGTMKDIGHVGGGPGEFQMPGGIFPLPGDSTLLLDYGNLRLSVIAPDGRIPRSTAMLTPEGSLISPRGVDAAGRIYFDQGGIRIGPDGDIDRGRPAPILRMTWEAAVVDTVAYLPLPELSGSSQSFSTGGGRVELRGLSPLQKTAAWAVAPDGRVAVVHTDPYRVEWYDPKGNSVQGPTVTYEPVRITDEDKEAWADRMGGGGAVMITAGGGGGGRSGSQTMRMPRPDPDDMEWPEVKPPFPANAARVTPDGALWVQRHVAYGQPQLFDVFDQTGVRVRQVELLPGRRIVGFGDGVVYVVNVDEDDLQWLEAYGI